MVIDYRGKYKDIVKKCYITEGYTDFNELTILLNNGIVLSDFFTYDTISFAIKIDEVISRYLSDINKQLIKERIEKIKKLK